MPSWFFIPWKLIEVFPPMQLSHWERSVVGIKIQSIPLKKIDDINATIAIDKEELGLRDFSTQNVSLEQIPDLARIKSFVVWFD